MEAKCKFEDMRTARQHIKLKS